MTCGTVAPHKGMERSMVLQGMKPLACISEIKDPEQYLTVQAERRHGFHLSVHKFMLRNERFIVFTLRENAHLIDQFLWLLHYGHAAYGAELYHRCMGKLYGYSDADIQAFIDSNINCNCALCAGVSK